MKLLKIGLVFIFLMSLGLVSVQAQSKNKEQVVYLLNGSIIRGKVIDDNEDIIRVQTSDKSELVYSKQEVEKIEDEIKKEFQSGYINHQEISFLGSATQPDETPSFGFQTFQGYQVHPFLSLGVMFGIDFFPNNSLLPLAFGLRGDLSYRQVSPFYSLDIGYGFPWLIDNESNEEYEGGMMFNPAIGIKIRLQEKSVITFSIGYKVQDTKNSIRFGNDFIEENKITFRRLSIKMGFGF